MSKKVIKLTQKNIESLVTKIIKEDGISELDKKTYTSAAAKARERGMSKLGDKFAAHGREHGTNVIDTISFEVAKRGTMVLRNLEFMNDRGDKKFKGELVSNDGDNGKIYSFDIFTSERGKELKTYMFGNNISQPSTVKDAKNYIYFLNDNGVDTFGLRPKQLTSGYADYMSENLSKKDLETQNTLNSNNKLLGELLKESLSEPKRVSYDVMIHKLNMGRELGEPDLSQMVDEVITDLTAYLGDSTSITGNKNTWPFK